MSKKVVIVDYGMGNLFSIQQAVRAVNGNALITNLPKDILNADRVILPGVGAFGRAMSQLKKTGLIESLVQFVKSERPLMGICLGMQLLFNKSYEFGETEGLGLIPGEVVHLKKLKQEIQQDFRVPHIGWNKVTKPIRAKESKIIDSVADDTFFYFVHSYAAVPVHHEDISMQTSYNGVHFCAAAQKNNIVGFQFHPEKSGSEGLRIYKAFLDS